MTQDTAQQAAMRREFEAWAKRKNYITVPADSDSLHTYELQHVEDIWTGWQASASSHQETQETFDGSPYLGRYATAEDGVTVTTKDAEPHCRVQEICLTDEQRKLLTVTRNVNIPGVPAPARGVQETQETVRKLREALEAAEKLLIYLGCWDDAVVIAARAALKETQS
jgi:hypothetical protein